MRCIPSGFQDYIAANPGSWRWTTAVERAPAVRRGDGRRCPGRTTGATTGPVSRTGVCVPRRRVSGHDVATTGDGAVEPGSSMPEAPRHALEERRFLLPRSRRRRVGARHRAGPPRRPWRRTRDAGAAGAGADAGRHGEGSGSRRSAPGGWATTRRAPTVVGHTAATAGSLGLGHSTELRPSGTRPDRVASTRPDGDTRKRCVRVRGRLDTRGRPRRPRSRRGYDAGGRPFGLSVLPSR